MSDPVDSEMPVWLVVIIPLAFFIFFPMMWCLVLWICSHVGGWNRLATRYRSSETPAGKKWTGVQGQVGLVAYKAALECTANEEGIFLQPGLILRFAHPLLFIPWTEFHEVKRTSVFWMQVVRADIGCPRVARVRLMAKVFEESEGRRLL